MSRGRRLLLGFLLMPALAGPGFAAAPHAGWRVVVVELKRVNTLNLPTPPSGACTTRVRVPLDIESEAGVRGSAFLIHLRIINASDSSQALTWDLTRQPMLALPSGRHVAPWGHRLPGLAAGSLALRGIVDVAFPSRAGYDLYSLFTVDAVPRGSLLAIDSLTVPARKGAAAVSR